MLGMELLNYLSRKSSEMEVLQMSYYIVICIKKLMKLLNDDGRMGERENLCVDNESLVIECENFSKIFPEIFFK
jgi:hypothetical protein